MTNQHLHINKYVQLHVIIFHQHVAVTLVTITRVSYSKNTIDIQLTVPVSSNPFYCVQLTYLTGCELNVHIHKTT